MALHLTSIFSQLAKSAAFRFLGRFIYPELIMVGLYSVMWIEPDTLGEKGITGLTMGLWLEFVFAHAGTALGVFGMFFPPKKTSGKVVLGCVSVFYFLFVGAVCYITGNVVTAIAFVVLCVKRVGGNQKEHELLREVGYSFGKVIWLVLAGALGYLVALVLPAPIENAPGQTGAEMTPAWGVVYFLGLHFIERYVAKKEAEGSTYKKRKSNSTRVIG